MRSRRSEAILQDLPPARRALAVSSFAAARAITRLTRRKRGGKGDVLVSFGNLGDQLRMLNVLSRFDLLAPIDVVCNGGTEAAFALYPVAGTIRGYANQGAEVLSSCAGRVLTSRAVYARALVPQPFVTQPLALAAAGSLAAETLYCTPYEDSNEGAVRLERSSWREAYEAFFSRAFGTAPAHDRPQIRSDLRYAADAVQRRAVVHFMTSAASRAVNARLWRDLLDRLAPMGLRIAVLGGESEEHQLREMCAGRDVEFWCGRPLEEVARLLATSRLFIGVDSSMMNLADAVGTPSVVLYVRTTPRIHGPYYSHSRAAIPRTDYRPVGVEPMISWTAQPPAGEIAVDGIMDAVQSVLR